MVTLYLHNIQQITFKIKNNKIFNRQQKRSEKLNLNQIQTILMIILIINQMIKIINNHKIIKHSKIFKLNNITKINNKYNYTTDKKTIQSSMKLIWHNMLIDLFLFIYNYSIFIFKKYISKYYKSRKIVLIYCYLNIFYFYIIFFNLIKFLN